MNNIKITDAEIDSVEADFLDEGQTFDLQRRNILKCLVSKDIKACPGSGKTTVLLAKIMLLSKQLHKFNGSGICVLTHTNVAMDEIKNRLGAKGNALFSYPNYFGTIQSFIDKFLAVPLYSEITKRRPAIIDSENYITRINNRFSTFHIKGMDKGIQNSAKYLLRSNVGLLNRIRFKRRDEKTILTDGISEKDITFKKPRFIKTKKDFSLEEKEHITFWLHHLKNEMLVTGVLHYDDAYFLAEYYLERHEEKVKRVFSERFKYVFIDEMQDTYPHQINILDRIFSEKVVLQRFGDSHQAIFGSHNDKDVINWNPDSSNCLHISQSKRFGKNVANPLITTCIEHNINLTGNENIQSSHPYIIIFNNSTRDNLLEKYSEIINEFESNSQEFANSKKPIKAVGWIGKRKEDLDKELCLPSYFMNYSKKLKNKKKYYTNLISYLCKQSTMDIDKSGSKIYTELLYEALLNLISLLKIKDANNRYYSSTTLTNYLKENYSTKYMSLRKKMALWIKKIHKSEDSYNKVIYEEIKTYYLHFCISIWDVEIQEEANSFLQNTEPEIREEAIKTDNFYSSNLNPNVNIEIATIHSVKGETHKATLYLETYFNRKYDVQEILDFLKGRHELKESSKPITKYILKLAYVAMSRPTHLLCVALHEEHLSATDIEELQGNNWVVVYA